MSRTSAPRSRRSAATGPRRWAAGSAEAEPSTASRRPRPALGRRAREAQHAVGHRLQPGLRDRRAAGVARSVRALLELGQGSLRTRERVLHRAADADVGQPADGLDRAVPDPLAEADRAAALRARREHRDPVARDVPARFELAPNGVEVRFVSGRGHPVVLPGRTAATGPPARSPPRRTRAPPAPT